MVAAMVIAKIIAVIGLLASSAFLVTLPNNSTAANATESHNNNLTEAPTFNDIKKDTPEFLKNLWDMLTAGVTGVAKFIAKSVIIIANWGLKSWLGIDANIPLWMGYVAFILIMVVLISTQWENIWGLFHHSFTMIIIFLAVIFVLGIALKMAHVI